MPIPRPNPGEEKNAFIGRCVSFLADEDPGMDNKQRVAICQTTWSRSREDMNEIHSDFKRILKDFMTFFKEEGKKKYEQWLKAYGLDPNKSYASQITRECLNGVCEAFSWTKPMIQFLKEDEGGKYYKLNALVATTSMNNNDYSGQDPTLPITKIERSARTLIYRPLNINHDHSRRLPFPENRVDWAEHEDNAVECIIRIDNSQRGVQRQIESGDIVNPSIEAIPRGGKRVDGRFVPDMWNFTELALLEKDVTLPGVPATFGIEPLFMNEGMAKGLVESVNWENKMEKEETEMTEKEEEYSFEKPETHTPATPEQVKEYWGIDGISTCGQCTHFEMTQPVNTSEPQATVNGAAVGDGQTTTSVGFGFSVGKCKVLEQLRGSNFYVKHGDWACSDGRPRQDFDASNRPKQNAASHESLEEVSKTAEEIELKKQIADLNEEVTHEKRETQKQREDNAKLRHEIVDLNERIADLESGKANDTSKTSRLTNDVATLREEVDNLKDTKADLDIDIKRKDKDIEYYKEQMTKYKDEVNNVKDELADKKAELSRVYEKLNDETEKRATVSQENRNYEDEKARLQTEISGLHVKISEMTREIADYAHNNSELAKSRIKDTEELTDIRKERDGLQEELRDTRRQLNQAKKRPSKIVLKT